MSDYTKKDAANETDSTPKDASKAWHSAREDAAGSGELEERNENKVSDSPEGKELYGEFKKAGMVGENKEEKKDEK
jgi:hypothetical protein